MTNDNQFDEILDHLLSEYREVEPLSGLEDRVLRRLQSQGNSRSASWRLARLGAFATSAALLLLAIFLITRSHQPQAPREQGSSTSPAPAAIQASATPLKNLPVATGRRPEPQTSMRPKASDVQSLAATRSPAQAFPIPARMTKEEHAWVAVAKAHPDVFEANVREDELITIAPVFIKPLASSTEHESE
jgi:hypothetical protein